MGEASAVDENDEGAMVATVTTENSTEVTVDNDYFEVADGNLKLKDDMSLDFENVEGGMIELTLTASGDGESATAMVTVTVNDVNEAPTIDVRDGEEVPGHDGVVSSLTIEENAMRADAPPLALIEVMDPDAADADMLTGDAGVAATSISGEQADKFAVILDPENGLWLHLAEGASLDHEADAEVMVTVTYTDSAGNMADATVTVMVTDMNEAPMAVGEVGNVPAEAGKALSHEVDLMALFSDPDGGDSIESWTLSGGPDWLELVTRQDDDGVTGILQGTPPTTGAGSAVEHMVTITATDSGGETASVSFYVAVDDGNDMPTGINLIDGGQSVIEVEVTEGDASGVVLGEVTVDDIDSSLHPYGQHLVTVSDDRFEIQTDDAGRKWLALKAGESLDYERDNGEVLVTLRAIDINGEKDEDDEYKGFRSDPVTFAVVINDVNDAPRGGTIGNWWVTVDEDLEAEDVDAGDWLTFSLETSGSFAAFRDADRDTLTYSISGPSWLQIDEETGEITNVENTIPTRGVYRVTVTATDQDGDTATASFNLNVALSDAAADGTLTADNSDPDISATSEPGYRELSGDQRVATFRAIDRDQDIPDHQFALKTVEITAITNADNASDLNNAHLIDHDGDDADDDGFLADGTTPATPKRLWTTADGTATGAATTTDRTDAGYVGPGYATAFKLSDPIPSSSAWTYHIEALDTDPNPRWDTTWLLNYETVDEIDITVRATDGTGASVEEDIQVRISDVNEAPRAPASARAGSLVLNSDLAVQQDAAAVKVLYIKLEDLWSDDRDSSSRLDFGASSSASWIDILHGPAEWGEIADGPDGDSGTADDIAWGDASANQPVIGTTDAAPARTEMVVIVEIDRTERNNQSDIGRGIGTFTLTATDRDGATGSRTYDVGNNIIDENLAAGSGAVSISGSAREGSTLRANFNDDRDPDLAGSATPATVLYTWYRVDADASGDPAGTPAVIRQSTSNTYTPVQADVGFYIGVVVNYYEVNPGDDTPNDTTDDAQLVANAIAGFTLDTLRTSDPANPTKDVKADLTSRVVSNTPDRGTADITVLADTDTLTVVNSAVRIVDDDYPFVTADLGDVVPYSEATVDGEVVPSISVSFEVSENGRGGWTPVDDDDVSFDDATDTTTLSLDDGEGKYYRAVVSYNADTGTDPATERVYSDPIQVSDVRDATGAPPLAPASITGSANPGGTLSVDVNANVTVQWQIQTGTKWADIPGATGDLRLTQDHAGDSIRAVVSYQSRDPDNPGTTAVTTVALTAPVGGTASDVRPIKVDDYEIEASVGGTGHGFYKSALFSPAGHNATIEHTVPLGSLFQDPDTSSFLVSYAAAASQTDGNLGTNSGASSNYVYEHAGGVLMFDARSGKLTYLSDQFQGHDGTTTDGTGNAITLEVNADDTPGPGGTNTGGTADIVLRINVAPTGITFRQDGADNANDADNTELTPANFVTAYGIRSLPQITITENDFEGGTEYKGPDDPTQAPLAVLDVLDQNLSGSGSSTPPVRGHKFGAHEITVTGDDRFVITKTGGNDPLRDADGDGSTWELHAVKGATFDYETDDMDGNPHNGIQIVLTFSATDGGGLSTPTPTAPGLLYTLGATTDTLAIPGAATTPPAAATAANFQDLVHLPIQLLVTIENAAQTDESDPPRRPDTETPGLKDDETDGQTPPGADTDDTEDNDTDGDTDGGDPTPPPPGMSLGGIIEDFIDNMDQGEQDLLEDYLLTIDDGLDIA